MENISSVKHEFVEQKILTIPIKKRKKGYGEKRNKYVKISLKKRKILLDKVFFENKNIKKVKIFLFLFLFIYLNLYKK